MKVLQRAMKALSRRFAQAPISTPPIWSGVYTDFDQIPVFGKGFSSGDAASAAERLLRETEAEPMPYEALIDHQLLAMAVRMMRSQRVTILDFGGGVGQSYAAIRRMIDSEITLAHCVLELHPVVEHARRIWAHTSEIQFVENFRDLPFAPDIVFAKGAIQYWPDYTDILRQLFSLSPSWLLLEKASMLIGREYATEQLNVYESRIPYWFMDLNRIVATANTCGYRLMLHRRLEREYDQSNFPPKLRIGRAASLLFERRS